MKLYLLLILSFALFQLTFSQFTRDISRESWTLLTPGQVDNSESIQSALKFGGDWIIRRGVLDGNIADTTYDVTGIYAVHLLNAPGITYKFELQVINNEGEIWRLKYDVVVDENTGPERVPRWRYRPEDGRWNHFGGYQNLPKGIYVPDGAAQEEEVVIAQEEDTPFVVPEEEAPIVIQEEEAPIVIQEEEAPVVIQEEEAPVVIQEEEAPVVIQEEEATVVIPEEEAPFVEIWEPIDPDVVDTNETIQTTLLFGINATLDIAVELGELPNFDYDMTGIYNVLTQINAPPDRDNFRFDVQVTNMLERLYRVKCDVAVNETTGRMWVYRFAYGPMDDPVWNGDVNPEFGEFDYLPDGEVFMAVDENNIVTTDDGATASLLL